MGSPLGLSYGSDDRGLPSHPNVNGAKNNSYQVIEGKTVRSLFGNAQFSPFPTAENKSSASVEKMSTFAEVHGDSSNDLSINSIIDYTNQVGRQAMKLDYAHFAYLKNVGVYPNNRLIIARRFAGAVGNDLSAATGAPMATLVSWVPEEQENFFAISFNEEWEEAAGSFEDILNEIGEDVKLSADQKGGAGKMVSEALNFVPMPSLMEGVQILVKQKLGLAGGGQGPGASPYGNPNLIREAKQRKVIPKGEAGSALTAKFSIDMVVEYEQKFINGVDPTLVYMDILQNALTFGTSDATFEYSGALARGANDIIGKLISGDIAAIVQAIYDFVNELMTAIKAVIGDLIMKLIDPPEEENEDAENDERSDRQKALDKADQYTKATISAFEQYFKISIGTVISKYKIRLLGVANALSGSNSTPWHVTIGNPKKPIFSSGDMLCTEVNVSLGKILAFNDLPQSIRIELKLENARNLGAQEIFNRFNTGRGRSYKRFQKSFVESDDAIVEEVKKKEIEIKNNEKNGDTQQPTPKVENDPTKLAATGGTQPTDTKPPSSPNVSAQDKGNTAEGDKVNNTTDDYDTPANALKSDWGSSTYLVSPPPPPKPIDQQGTASVDNSAKTSPSDQSANSPNTKTSGVAPTTNANNTTPNSTLPGVTQSASTLQQQQAAGVTGSQAPQPENLPIPIPEPDPPVREPEPEIVIGPDGKPTWVYPPGTNPADTATQAKEETAKQEATAAANAPQPAPTEDTKKEFDRNEKQKARFREASDYDLATYYSNLQAQIASKEREIASYQKALSENPNFATDDPDEYQFILEDLQDLQDERDAAIKASANIKEELKNRKK